MDILQTTTLTRTITTSLGGGLGVTIKQARKYTVPEYIHGKSPYRKEVIYTMDLIITISLLISSGRVVPVCGSITEL